MTLRHCVIHYRNILSIICFRTNQIGQRIPSTHTLLSAVAVYIKALDVPLCMSQAPQQRQHQHVTTWTQAFGFFQCKYSADYHFKPGSYVSLKNLQ